MKTHVFHKGATAISKGTFLDNGSGEYKTLSVSIKGDTTSHKVEFKFMNAFGDLEALKGIKPSTWATGTETTGNNETWDFDITNKKKIYMDITAINAGAGSLDIVGEAGCE